MSLEEFDADPLELTLSPGDFMVGCTDGAFERFDAEGVIAGFGAFQQRVCQCHDLASPDAARETLASLDDLQDGPPDDDTVVLIVSMPVPVGRQPAANDPTGLTASTPT